MPNSVRVRFRRFRALIWCLVLSLTLHSIVVPLIAGLFARHGAFAQPPEEVVYRTSSLELTNPVRPQPPRPHRVQPQPAPPRARPSAPSALNARAPLKRHRELARIDPRAGIRAARVSTAFDPSAQQAQYERTIARLRQQADPLSGVADASRAQPTDAPAKHYAFDFAASMGAASTGEGILTPVRSWRDGPFTYYYVKYWVQYADGSTETGIVPWPLRYLPKEDPFLQHWEHFPLPGPLPDFQLPPGTNLHPLVAFCYEHRSELNSCPPEHG